MISWHKVQREFAPDARKVSAQLFRGPKRILLAAHREGGNADRGQMVDAQRLWFAWWVKRVGEQNEAPDGQAVGHGHGAHPAAE